MKVKFLGDLHCSTTKDFGPNVIQVGDLCLTNYERYGPYPKLKRFFIDGNHEAFPFLNPDAEQPYQVKEGLVYIPRGFFSGEVLFIGGAGSVDFNLRLYDELYVFINKNKNNIDPKILEAFGQLKAKRFIQRGLRWEDQIDPILIQFYKELQTKHEWFPEEDITDNQLKRILDTNRIVDVVVAHDCPYSVLSKIVPSVIEQFAASNYALEKIFEKFKPKLWIFGHHHKHLDFIHQDCRFVCLNICQLKEFDVPLADNFFDLDY